MRIIEKIKIIFFLLAVSVLILPAAVGAGPLSSDALDEMKSQNEKFTEKAGYQTASVNDLSSMVGVIIKGFIGLLGIIFIILIILAGYNWMTAMGEEAKVDKAKETLKRAIIGLCIIIASYAITYYVFNALPWGNNPGSNYR